MLLLVGGDLKSVLRYRTTPRLGRLVQPRDRTDVWGTPREGVVWAADNDAFQGFKQEPYERMLDTIAGIPGCLFVTAPDVVGDSEATLAMFEKWEPQLRDRRLPIALVAQDGLTIETAPWDRFDALFVGGGTEWKLGVQAALLVREARRLGKWVHMGRVNSYRRLEYARSLDVDSVDGSQWARFKGTYLPQVLAWLDSPPQAALEVG